MKNIYPFFITGLICCCSFITHAQQGVDYTDVGVIVNMNDSGSMAIANYFMAKRSIPSVNLIPVYTTSEEEINDSIFRNYEAQITTYINNNNLAQNLDYLVTTKGCPLKVNRANPADCNASCESELMLLPPNFNSYTGDCASDTDISYGNFFANPYFMEATAFYSVTYQIYLVTRLDAYTVANVLDLIDHSGPNIYVNKDSVLFVLDQSPNWAGNPLNSGMVIAADTLLARGWQVNLNTDSVFVIDQSNVIGYFSWGSNDGYSQDYTQNAIPHNTWVKGSISETCVSTSGRSFEPGTPYGQSLIADLLAEGSSAAKGYVYEPYTIAIAHPDILFDRYTNLLPDGTPQYNLAQSYFSASEMISWMDVVIGDPKTSITTNPTLAGIKEINNLHLAVYPNPTTGTVHITASLPAPSKISIMLTDITGRQMIIQSYQASGNFKKDLDVSALPDGIYNLTLRSGEQFYNQKVLVAK